MMAHRRICFVTQEHLGRPGSSTGIRIDAMVACARDAGLEVSVVGPGAENIPLGVSFFPLRSIARYDRMLGDALIVSPYLPMRYLFRVLRSDLPLHADFYCVTASEILGEGLGWKPSRISQAICRRKWRYRMVLGRSERIYLSHINQGVLLAGLSLWDSRFTQPELADRLPSISDLVPIGVRPSPPPADATSPWPEALQGQPILLWGGGIWPWFDVETAIRATHLARTRGSRSCLFFLSGSNPTADPHRDKAYRDARSLAEAIGAAGCSVWFNERTVFEKDLPPYLLHASAGLMANRASLESVCSWRTRYLDLIWAGRPLLAAGVDPLGETMEAAGAATIVPAGDVEALAESVLELERSPDRRAAMCSASAALAGKFSWERSLARFRKTIVDPARFHHIGRKPSALDLARYFLAC